MARAAVAAKLATLAQDQANPCKIEAAG